MSPTLYFAGCFAFSLPFLSIAAILIYNALRRAPWRRSHGRDATPRAFCSSSAVLGTILLFAQIFYRPSTVHAVEARLEVDADEEDSGDPDTAARQLSRQLRQIGRGEPVEQLTVRQ
jgi:hypothetical protein